MSVYSVASKEFEESGHDFFGSRMVSAGLISKEQCDNIVSTQTTLRLKGEWIRFGELAVEKGFCSANDVECIPGFLGQKLIDAGILSNSQQDSLVKWQARLRDKGYDVRFGELCISEGFCSKKEIDELIS